MLGAQERDFAAFQAGAPLHMVAPVAGVLDGPSGLFGGPAMGNVGPLVGPVPGQVGPANMNHRGEPLGPQHPLTFSGPPVQPAAPNWVNDFAAWQATNGGAPPPMHHQAPMPMPMQSPIAGPGGYRAMMAGMAPPRMTYQPVAQNLALANVFMQGNVQQFARGETAHAPAQLDREVRHVQTVGAFAAENAVLNARIPGVDFQEAVSRRFEAQFQPGFDGEMFSIDQIQGQVATDLSFQQEMDKWMQEHGPTPSEQAVAAAQQKAALSERVNRDLANMVGRVGFNPMIDDPFITAIGTNRDIPLEDTAHAQESDRTTQSRTAEDEEMARVAGELVDTVDNNTAVSEETAEKFRGSTFLDIMRNMKEGRKIVRDGDIVDVDGDGNLGYTASDVGGSRFGAADGFGDSLQDSIDAAA